MKKIIFILAAGLFVAKAFSQNSNVSIYDLIVIQSFNMPQNPGSINSIDTSMINLRINFKISNIQDADSVFVLIGDDKDNANSMYLSGKFIFETNKYYVSINSVNYKVYNNLTAFIVLNDIQKTLLNNANYATLYLKDKQSLLTQKLYFKMK